MPIVDLAIMRHGEYQRPANMPSAHLPHPLTQQGHLQATNAAHHLADYARRQGLILHHALFSSALLRAFQTAQTCAQQLEKGGLGEFSVKERPRLAERCVGPLANLTLDQIQQVVAKDPRHGPLPAEWKSRADFKLPYPGTESLLEAGKRVRQEIDQILAEVREKALADTLVVVVGHGASLRYAFVDYGHFDQESVGNHSMHHAKPLLFRFDQQGPQLMHGQWKNRAATPTMDGP